MKPKNKWNDVVQNQVFWSAFLLLSLIAIWAGVSFDSFSNATNSFISIVRSVFGSYMNFVMTACLLTLIYFMVSKKGELIIGGKDAKPDIKFGPWCAIVLTGGIGSGIVFWCIAEPMTHFTNPALNWGVAPGSPEAGIMAMSYSYGNWAFHPYAAYGIVGLCVALATYSFKLPLRASSAFYPIAGERIRGTLGFAIDSLTVCTYIIAVSTTFALAATQIAGGFEYFAGLKSTKAVSVWIIIALTVLFAFLCITGVKKGITYAANCNTAIYFYVIAFAFIAGPTVFLFDLLGDSVSYYINNFFTFGLFTDAFDTGGGWTESWPIFYWAWFLSCSVVVGVFMAKISRGRTVRQFILVNVVIPAIFAIFWFNGLGGSAIFFEYFQNAGIAEAMSTRGMEIAVYEFFTNLPFSKFHIAMFLVAVILSFVTCANAVISAMASMCQKTSIEEDGMDEPPNILKIALSIIVCALSIACLLLGNAREMQSGAIAAGLPGTLIVLGCLAGTFYFTSAKYQNGLESKKSLREIREDKDDTIDTI